MLDMKGRQGDAVGRRLSAVLIDGRRTYCGFLAHLGLVGLTIGVAGSSLGALQGEFEIRAGDSVRWAGRTIRFDGVERMPEADKTIVAARLVVTDALGRDETLRPAQHYHHLQEIWTTEAAVQSLVAGDFYAVVRHGEADSALFLFLWNPLIWCVWCGGWMIGIAGLLGVIAGCVGRKRGRAVVTAGRSHLAVGGKTGNHMECSVPSIDASSTPARRVKYRGWGEGRSRSRAGSGDPRPTVGEHGGEPVEHPAGEAVMSQKFAVVLRDVRKSLGGRSVLRAINLAIVKGECTRLRGENGSGKTTLLRCMAGLLEVDGGSVEWLERLEAGTQRVGLVGHQNSLHPQLTLGENLMLTARLLGLSEAKEQVQQGLQSAGLLDHASRLPREVSQGMRRRAAIARVLLVKPAILLLDEPGAGLDETGRGWLSEAVFSRYQQGLTTCLVSHDDLLELPAGQRVLELRGGKLLSGGTAAEAPLQGRLTDLRLAGAVS